MIPEPIAAILHSEGITLTTQNKLAVEFAKFAQMKSYFDFDLGYEDSVKRFRRAFIMHTLKRCKGNQCHAAAALGMHRNSVARWMDELKIPRNYGRGKGVAA